jgi:hypothetical protein
MMDALKQAFFDLLIPKATILGLLIGYGCGIWTGFKIGRDK